jgi:c-di-GMP-binding flagellar brake protein YcgR
MSGFTGMERRKFKRVKVGLTVVYRKNGPLHVLIRDEKGENEAVMVDIGEGGMAIRTDVNVTVGTELTVKFTLFDSVGPKGEFFGALELLGKVGSNNLMPDGLYRLGIAFLNVNEYTRKDISNFVSMIESRLKGS